MRAHRRASHGNLPMLAKITVFQALTRSQLLKEQDVVIFKSVLEDVAYCSHKAERNPASRPSLIGLPNRRTGHGTPSATLKVFGNKDENET